jgi:hypothetical protein
MSSFTLSVVNNSPQPGTFVLCQQVSGASSLAWMVRQIPPGPPTQIQWNDQVSFVWGQTGPLAPGVVFRTAQSVPADPSNGNLVTFTQQNGMFMFENPTSGPSGAFTVQPSGSVAPNQAAVGVGLSNAALSVQMAQPNFQVQFRLSTTYGLFLSPSPVQPGQVIDADQPGAARIQFPSGGGSMKATFNPDGTWTVSPG